MEKSFPAVRAVKITPLFKFNPNFDFNINPDPEWKKVVLGVAGIVGLCIGISSIVLGYYYFTSNDFTYSNKTETVNQAYCNLIVELLLHHKGFYNKADPIFTVEVIKSLFSQLNEFGYPALNFNDIQYIFKMVYSRENFVELQETFVINETPILQPTTDEDGFPINFNNLKGNAGQYPVFPTREEIQQDCFNKVAYINDAANSLRKKYSIS